MSIIIKGIDLPKDSKGIELVFIPKYGDIIYNESMSIGADRIIEIPTPHGRLIDERELESKIHDVTLEGGTLHGCVDKTKIHECKTILEAEEE